MPDKRQGVDEGGRTEFSSCEKVEVAVLGFPVLMSLAVSVDVKQH